MKEIICLSPSRWSTFPSRTQQLMARLTGAKLLFFEPPGHRQISSGRKVRPGITVYTLPPILDVDERHRLLFQRGCHKQARFILRQMEHHRIREPLFWCGTPEGVHFLELIPHRGVVYDCARDWSDLPPRWESDMALAADVVFAASQQLVEHLAPCNDNIALLPNGVNFPMFTRPPTERPQELVHLPGSILGYVGTIWPDLDLTPALYAAQALPSATLVFLGRRMANPTADALEHIPNVRFLGPRTPVEVPDYLSCFDVCMNFLRLNDPENDILSPRIYEYLASGAPIVSMLCMDQVEPYPDVIYSAHTPEQFGQLCAVALRETGSWARTRRREHAAQAAWSLRSEQALRILSAIGLY